MNVAQLREDFPALNRKTDVGLPVYFDNACVTLRPYSVIRAMNEYYEKFSGCHRRAYHAFARETASRFERARASVAAFLGATEPSEIIFLRNTTEAINLVARSFAGSRRPARVLTTELEHNSNLIPWMELSRQGLLQLSCFKLADNLTFDKERFRAALTKGADLVSIPHKSHVTGCEYPVREIADMAHEAGALLLLDGAQGVSYGKIDVHALGADFYAFSAHKMLGPSGFGALYADKEHQPRLAPLILGGETVDDVSGGAYSLTEPPYCYEAGLQNYAGALGLEAAVDYLAKADPRAIRAHIASLNAMITAGISGIQGLSIIGPDDPALRSNILNFTAEGIDSVELAEMLDKTARIMVRAGKLCSHAWYNSSGTPPSVRLSLYFYNTNREAELFVKTLRNLINHFY
ncbi:MAG: hypothetical protein A2X34_00665 [Elusimicrobia bacterium GWC2_51_8]|nr:MAG: hypothetical protein A2X33_06430 [Elusimicrobia bacterium GWA2_51_34]OGR64130.1 MAG: hypothetical protein A2X34_00665 [Elusimicrobia bacterium GWC2_51_8]OGR86755.1 MAG: hypothetical protein A2021_09725 [Elusimicrobia bacterium GWF2_52_66]